ncbi:alpha-D-ribose 1-methylphosphonate 5-triphosphate diphosphatase [Roseibium polysiphoniae]|uniref:alpha-D-ribose 1-methylphosphonate 5-triphosphate diphosphatase n=1 Tax=Roseibium polysiphoniae TaxID=2571221 RepID=UPI003298E9A4
MRPTLIRNGRVLIADTLEDADLLIQDGIIQPLGALVPGNALQLDARDRLVLPGIVDVHGDAFERQIMPRPKVSFDLPLALAETDRQLAANGITTAYHGLTLSWEPGLRSIEAGSAFLETLDRVRKDFSVDHRVQIRWETFAFEAIDLISDWLKRPLDLAIAFNDHTSSTHRKITAGNHSKLSDWASRAGLSNKDYLARFGQIWERRAAVGDAIDRVATMTRASGVPMLSHDDLTLSDRTAFRSLGSHIAEFPLAEEIAADARAYGEHCVFGAPNVVRGGSHTNAPTAADMITRDLGTILASDYYYPAMFSAAQRLIRDHSMPLEKAWAQVSINPAQAMTLADRGRIEPGLRGDIVIAQDLAQDNARIEATLSKGTIAYLANGALLC